MYSRPAWWAAAWLLVAGPCLADPAPAVTPSFSVAATSEPVVTSSTPWRSVPNTVFQPGEDLLFVITWGVITGGYSTLSVQSLEGVNGRPAYRLVEEAHSTGVVGTFYHVVDRNDTWLDADSLTTVRYEKRIREGKYRIE